MADRGQQHGELMIGAEVGAAGGPAGGGGSRAGLRRIPARLALPTAGVLIGALVGVLLYFTATPYYTARITVLPSPSGGTGGILDQFASLTGTLVAEDSGRWEVHFGRILVSAAVLDALAEREWNHADFATPISLAQVFDIPGWDDPEVGDSILRQRLREVLRRRSIDCARDKFTGFIVIKVGAPRDPVFAAEFANALVAELEAVVDRMQAATGTEKRQFLALRVADAEAALNSASAALTEFASGNRSYQESPVLVQRYGELEREVQAQTSLWIELRRQLELARIEELRNPLVVHVLDAAQPPVRPSSPILSLMVLVSAALGGLSGAALELVLRPKWSRPN